MTRVCHSCNKKALKGNLVSHANNKSKHARKPNLQSRTVEINGVKKKVLMCVRCIKSVGRS